MDDLTTTTGIVALVGVALALVALACAVTALAQLRRLRAAQRVVLGNGARDLVTHAAELGQAFESLRAYVEESALRLDGRLGTAEDRLDHAVAYRGVLRYDAYNEMSGRQSASIALLDATRSGIVLSSIHHRDQARLYAKQVRDGAADIELSPEEEEAVRLALADEVQEAPRG
ncbi:MAG: hypothetical protein JWP17_457 [Solirubrobacterales bacterium]|nr:hypothetical protein [Solirubrobacterales bacterium]